MSHGSWRVMLVYACGVLSGSLAASVFDHKIYLAGASGGCYALVRNRHIINPNDKLWLMGV